MRAMTLFSSAKSICGMIALLVSVASNPVTLANEPVTLANEPVTGSDRIEALKMIIARNEANRRKIETWEGTYRFVDRFPQRVRVQHVPGKPDADTAKKAAGKVEERNVITIREGSVRIALDVAADKLWTDFREDIARTRFVSEDNKGVVEKPEAYSGYQQKTILVPDSETVLLPNVPYGPVEDIKGDPLRVSGKEQGKLVERKAYSSTLKLNQTDEIIDPRQFYMEGSKYLGESLTVTVDALLGKYGEEIRSWVDQHTKMSKSGTAGALEYRLTLQFRDGTNPELDAIGLSTHTTRFSERDGFLPVEDSKLGISGEIQMTRSWRYQQIDGIRVPAEYRYTFNQFKDQRLAKGAILVMDRLLLLVEAKLNAPLPEQTFATEALELEKGDRLVDRIEQKLYVHDGAGLVPASQYSETSQRKAGWLFWLTIAALIVVVGLFVRRWRHAVNVG